MFPVSSRFGTSRCGGTRRHHGVGVDLRVWGEVDLGMAGWGGRREGASDQGFPGTPTWNWSKVGGCMGYIHDRNTLIHGLNGSGPGTFPLWTGKVHFVIRSSSRPGMFPVSACETYCGGSTSMSLSDGVPRVQVFFCTFYELVHTGCGVLNYSICSLACRLCPSAFFWFASVRFSVETGDVPGLGEIWVCGHVLGPPAKSPFPLREKEYSGAHFGHKGFFA
jgi:hypothetical protein